MRQSPVISNYISNQNITAFAEDQQGHIWIGTSRGLNKFDVYEYHQYLYDGHPQGLPDNRIEDLMLDSQGQLWVVTDDGPCVYTDEDNFRRIPFEPAENVCRQIFEDLKGRIFINTYYSLSIYNPEKDCFECLIPDLDRDKTHISQCYVDNKNNIWAVSPYHLRLIDSQSLTVTDSIPLDGFYFKSSMMPNGEIWLSGSAPLKIFNSKSRQFVKVPDVIAKHPDLSRATIEIVHPYANNEILITTTRQGTFIYSPGAGYVLRQTDPGFPVKMPDFKISTLFTDSQKNLWIGSQNQGYAVRYSYKETFNNNLYLSSYFQDKAITALEADKSRQLWISSQDKGLFVFNMDRMDITKVDLGEILPGEKEPPEIVHIFCDASNCLWLVFQDHRIAKCRYEKGKLHSYGVNSLHFARFTTQDKNGTIWVSTSSLLLFSLKKDEKEFQLGHMLNTSYTYIPYLLPLNDGNILVLAYQYPLTILNPDTMEETPLPLSEEDHQACFSHKAFIPTVAYQDASGDLWVGSISNGLFRYSFETGRASMVEGISCPDVSSIEEDWQGNIWVGTLYGLCKIDSGTERVTNYYAADGIGGNQFLERSSCRLPDGSLVFGGTHGLTFFNPLDVRATRKSQLVFEDLKIHNQLVRPGENECIAKHLSHCSQITLDHTQNSFSISFAALDYREHYNVHYHYKLDGFDRDWIDSYTNREAYYANLDAGNYTFRVRVTNHDGSVVEAEKQIDITIKPAWWCTWWAWAFYIIAAAAVIWALLSARKRIETEKNLARQAELDKEHEQRTNKMNMSYFANISHEFRTPLTMISGPIRQLCSSPGISDKNRSLLNIVGRNIDRMLRLVNQLMDFNLLENDTLKLAVQHADIIAVLRQVISIYEINAKDKNIALTTCGIEDSLLAWIDTDKIEKILNNLMSNAMKFTPQGGDIKVGLDEVSARDIDGQFNLQQQAGSARYVKVSVTNTGDPIPNDQLEKIFERYYQVDNRLKGVYNWGTGIGLYFARALARLHHGDLRAANLEHNAGVTFTLVLPTGKEAYSEKERIQPSNSQQYVFPIDNKAKTEQPPQNSSGKTVFIVDDDTEVVHYLTVLLSPEFHVVSSFSAQAALKAIRDEAPDLILSDVVMPGTDGYELCRQIKSDLQLCHIPVILVTAKTTIENQVEGLNTGADAYVTKPFDPAYLIALLQSQFKNRDRVRQLLATATHTDKIETNALSPQDNAFMTELYKLMEENLSNSELDISLMTEMMRISRSKFYYKVKGLTGQSPAAFFKTYKLNRAAELIIEGTHTVSEIADLTGFSTPSFFSSSFKKQFGVPPREYGHK